MINKVNKQVEKLLHVCVEHMFPFIYFTCVLFCFLHCACISPHLSVFTCRHFIFSHRTHTAIKKQLREKLFQCRWKTFFFRSFLSLILLVSLTVQFRRSVSNVRSNSTLLRIILISDKNLNCNLWRN